MTTPENPTTKIAIRLIQRSDIRLLPFSQSIRRRRGPIILRQFTYHSLLINGMEGFLPAPLAVDTMKQES
jgi:hypothetical protein